MAHTNTGTWSVGVGLGIDLTIFTLYAGVSYGLSEAYKERDGLSNDARFFTYLVTAGVVLGGSTR